MSFSLNEYIELARKEGHSKHYIRDISNYVLCLKEQNLPVIFSTKHLANCLGFEYYKLKGIINGSLLQSIEFGVQSNLIQEASVIGKRNDSKRLKGCISLLPIPKDISAVFSKKSRDGKDGNRKERNDFPWGNDNPPSFDDFEKAARVISELNSYEETEDPFGRYHTNYNYFRLRKKSGGVREIMVPDPELKNIQRWILCYILEKINLHDKCTGFRKNKSIKDNAGVHVNQEVILKVDLLRFFDTITRARVIGLFKSLGYHPNLSIDLAKLTTAEHRKSYWIGLSEDEKSLINTNTAILPQGAPTSPAIANIICRKLDLRFAQLGKKIGYKYSRYADDLTFSGKFNNLPSMNVIKKIIKEEGFFINEKKVG
jgi:hypothetical protein